MIGVDGGRGARISCTTSEITAKPKTARTHLLMALPASATSASSGADSHENRTRAMSAGFPSSSSAPSSTPPPPAAAAAPLLPPLKPKLSYSPSAPRTSVKSSSCARSSSWPTAKVIGTWRSLWWPSSGGFLSARDAGQKMAMRRVKPPPHDDEEEVPPPGRWLWWWWWCYCCTHAAPSLHATPSTSTTHRAPAPPRPHPRCRSR
jgi:hypothetical protein